LLVTQYAEYEQVVVEDRIEKEKARRKVDQEAKEIAAAVKVSFILSSVRDRTYLYCIRPRGDGFDFWLSTVTMGKLFTRSLCPCH